MAQAVPGPSTSSATIPNPSIMRKLESANERMEMIVNTSRILTLEQKLPQVQVNNPDILQVVPLSPNQIQISAKKPGVTQVNLWTDDKKIYTVDVIVFGDARELAEVLKSQFPNAALTVTPVANSVRISGFVDNPVDVPQILRIAEEYYPKVINNIAVSGVQQVLLHVKIMEVSRTKLRTLGIDWAQISSNSAVVSSPTGLISSIASGSTSSGWVENPNTGVSYPVQSLTAPSIGSTGVETFRFGVVNGTNAFFGVLEALREDKLMKILAEPTLVAYSGRVAQFNVGGEIPVLVPQSLGTTSIQYKPYGTQLDFLPIVLGSGRIRLEVRPKVSEVDPANSVELYGIRVPGLRSRWAETGVEMEAGQSLAIAGLIQTRVETERRGLPWVSDVPYLGAFFRRDTDKSNEIELLILVTPDLVDPMDPDQVPPCGPGSFTTQPTDCELYWKGFIEVPRCGGGPCAGGDQACPGGAEQDASGDGQPSESLPGPVLAPQPDPQMTRAGAPSASGRAVASDRWRNAPAADTQYRSDRQNPSIRQMPRTAGNPQPPKPLPGFKGSVGYEMLR